VQKKEITWWSAVQALIVCVGIVFLLMAFVAGTKGLFHEVCLAFGATLMSVGSVALVYDIIGRARMLQAFKEMLVEHLGAKSADVEGISRVTCDFAHLPEVLDEHKFPAHLLLVGLDCERFMNRYDRHIRTALIGSRRRRKQFRLTVLLQDRSSNFAKAISDLQGTERVERMCTSQDTWLVHLNRLIDDHPHVALVVRVRFSVKPILGGLAIAVGYRGELPDCATYSPYLRVAPDEITPSLCIYGPDTHLFKIMKEHFRALWDSATPYVLHHQDTDELANDTSWLPK